MIPTLFTVSLAGGFFSGLLGVGGAVILIPLLLTAPRLTGAGALSMHTVAGLTMLQVLAATVTGCCAHRRYGYTHMPTILAVGLPMGIFAFAGAAISASMSEHAILFVFGCLVALAALMLAQRSPGELTESRDFRFDKRLSAAAGSCVGFFSGIAGAGGGFILVPVMIRILGIPVRIAVGSSLGVLFIGSLMGALGKALTCQVEWRYLAPVIAGALPASLLGAHLSSKISPAMLRRILLALMLLILVKTWHEFFAMLAPTD